MKHNYQTTSLWRDDHPISSFQFGHISNTQQENSQCVIFIRNRKVFFLKAECITEYKALLTGSALFTAAWRTSPCGALKISLHPAYSTFNQRPGRSSGQSHLKQDDIPADASHLAVVLWLETLTHTYTGTQLTLTNTWLVPAVIAAGHLPTWQGEFLPVHSHRFRTVPSLSHGSHLGREPGEW